MGGTRHPYSEPRSEVENLLVMVVDDHDANRRIMQYLLTGFGCRPVLAACGEEAVEHAAAQPFDLILMDLHMPGIDGDETTRLIRAEGASRGAYILRWTTDVAVRFEPGLYDGEAPKSMSLPELSGMIREACRRASRRSGKSRTTEDGDAKPQARRERR